MIDGDDSTAKENSQKILGIIQQKKLCQHTSTECFFQDKLYFAYLTKKLARHPKLELLNKEGMPEQDEKERKYRETDFWKSKRKRWRNYLICFGVQLQQNHYFILM